jgi:hypothetical protein
MKNLKKTLEGYKVMFGGGVGEGYITTSPITDLNKKPVSLAGETLIAGQKTTLQGFFARPIEYVGCIKIKNKMIELVFHFGFENTLFETKYYYESLHKVSAIRVFKMYSFSGGRDFNFKNNKWK